jgi:hypothetical protein
MAPAEVDPPVIELPEIVEFDIDMNSDCAVPAIAPAPQVQAHTLFSILTSVNESVEASF